MPSENWPDTRRQRARPGASCPRRRSPVSVTNRASRMVAASAAMSCSRPTKLVPSAVGTGPDAASWGRSPIRRVEARPSSSSAGGGRASSSADCRRIAACCARKEEDGSSPSSSSSRFRYAAEGLQRLGLTAASVQGKHQLCSRPLAQRVEGRERSQLSDQLGGGSRGQVDVESSFHRHQLQLVQPRGLGGGEGLVGELDQGRTTPQLERLVQDLPRPPVAGPRRCARPRRAAVRTDQRRSARGCAVSR